MWVSKTGTSHGPSGWVVTGWLKKGHKEFVAKCTICQQVKYEHLNPCGLT